MRQAQISPYLLLQSNSFAKRANYPGAAMSNRAFVLSARTRMLAQPSFLQTLLSDRRRSGAVAVQSLAWLLAVLVVAWVVAGWLWQFIGTEPTSTPEAAPILDHAAAVQAITTRHLLGQTSAGDDDARGSANSVHWQLLGAMTGSPEAAGFAILAEEGKPAIPAVEGETFAPGVTLEKVLPGAVRLKIGERVETIEIKESKASSAPTKTDAVTSNPPETPRTAPTSRPGSSPRNPRL
ncbi:MAG TPA: type II secretion system protein N [Rhodocyclaceae bacterium]|nr:type II secretion system protein N [Rhodocyclaceae bacterium]